MPIFSLCCLFLHTAGNLSLPLLLLWEGVVSLALFGYGLALLRLLGLKGKPLAVAGCAGVAAWTLLGGWLNLLHAASRGVLIGLLLFGTMLGGIELLRSGMRERWSAAAACLPASRAGRSAAVLLGLYFLLVFAANVRPVVWNEFDDLQAYMPFAEKASLRGAMQADVFSQRRVSGGLGSATFFSVTMLASGDGAAMGFLDAGFGYVLFLTAMSTLLRAMGLRGGRLLAVMFFVPVFTLGKLNLTPVNLSSALLLGMLLLFGEEEGEVQPGLLARQGVLLGLLLAALCTMKSTNIPFVCLFALVAGVVLSVRSGGGRRFGAYLSTVPAAVAVLLPWIVVSLRTTGTLLFPILGRGYDASAYGVLPLPSATAPTSQVLLLAFPDVLLLVLAGCLILVWNRSHMSALALVCLSFVTVSAVSLVMNGLATAGEALDRYALPYMSVAALFFFGYLALAWTGDTKARSFRFAAAVACFWVMFYLYIVSNRERLNQQPAELLALAGLRKPFYGYEEILNDEQRATDAATIGRAQSAVPPGVPIIESAGAAYAFNWQRNPVYVADLPGLGGPPPGMPISDDPEDTRQYLLKCGIRYLIFDRSLLLHHSDFHKFLREPMHRIPYREIARHYIRTRVTATWVRLQGTVAEHTWTIFSELADHGHPVYDDGRVVVVPL